jgi:hypothetical protein
MWYICGVMKCIHRKPEDERPLGRHRPRWDENTEKNLKK